MPTTYAQKQSTAQKKDANSAASVVDNSSQGVALQRKADSANGTVQRAETSRPNNTGMPDNLKAGIESLSGFSMDDVRVHYNSSKPATVQALAYTQGTDIHVAPGQEKCLPHEAWHVAQQMAGRVSPTTNINGMPVNDNAALEHEADVMGEKAVTQRKENVEIKSQNVYGGALQLKPGGDVDLVCAADVLYFDKKTLEKKHVKGVGYNDPETASDVLLEFGKHGLTNLANGSSYDANVVELMKKKKGGLTDEEGEILRDYNPAGQCAEPHAFANALKNRDEISVENIIDVFISESVIRKIDRKVKKNDSTGKSEIVRDAQDNVSKGDGNNTIITYSRCKTCAQWIQNDGHVKPYYLQRGTENPGVGEKDFSKVEKIRVLKKYKHCKDVFGKMVFDDKQAFHNVDFLCPEKNNPKVDLNQDEKIPEWFTCDVEARTINELPGLRTVIKKQLLKNRNSELQVKIPYARSCADALPCIISDSRVKSIISLILPKDQTDLNTYLDLCKADYELLGACLKKVGLAAKENVDVEKNESGAYFIKDEQIITETKLQELCTSLGIDDGNTGDLKVRLRNIRKGLEKKMNEPVSKFEKLRNQIITECQEMDVKLDKIAEKIKNSRWGNDAASLTGAGLTPKSFTIENISDILKRNVSENEFAYLKKKLEETKSSE